jgi:hypothetical protein
MKSRRLLLVLAIVGGAAAAGLLGIWLALRSIGEGDAPSPYDAGDTAPSEDLPDYSVSSPELNAKAANAIQRQVLAADGAPLPWAPYFFQLMDGRWVFGYADEKGYTRPFYTKHPTQYELFTYEAALERFARVRDGKQERPSLDTPRANPEARTSLHGAPGDR